MPELGFKLEVKSVEESGTFSGLASTYNVVDRGGDVVLPGAFTETLRKSNERPLLWSHDTSEPIGLGVLEDTAAGLVVKGQLDLDVAAGRDAYSRIRKKICKGLSIGYLSVKDSFVNGARHLAQVELFEISLCVFPMNPAATVHMVKSIRSRRDFEHWLHSAGGFSKSQSKRLARSWDDDAGLVEEEEDGEVLAWLRSRKREVGQ